MMYVPNTFTEFCVAGMMVLAVIGAVNDIRDYRIPNSINLGLAGLFPIYAFSGAAGVDWAMALLIAGGMFFFAGLLFSLGQIGGGDAKMMTVLALWAGPAHIVDFVLVTTIVGGVLAVLMMTSARHALALACESIGQQRLGAVFLGNVLPYGVAIAVGGVVVGFKLIAG
ncbi:MAG: prepilin peptidase [Rhodospirillales bacterium]|nr:prepilin peptidase [Rhodospirillales bacterium]MDP6646705.1 prepilin peptidase [Rhodospirillales bacterium]MDP6842596.1 prepilin peptidase [Rhodospirillales bacterium]